MNFSVFESFAKLAIQVDNSNRSDYHGLQIEVNRRFASGLFFQTNYILSKVLADTTFLTSRQEAQNYCRLMNRRLD